MYTEILDIHIKILSVHMYTYFVNTRYFFHIRPDPIRNFFLERLSERALRGGE